MRSPNQFCFSANACTGSPNFSLIAPKVAFKRHRDLVEPPGELHLIFHREQFRQHFADAHRRVLVRLTIFDSAVSWSMKLEDCKSMLRSVEHAIQVCDESSGVMDKIHLEICRELRETRQRLKRLMAQMEREGTS